MKKTAVMFKGDLWYAKNVVALRANDRAFLWNVEVPDCYLNRRRLDVQNCLRGKGQIIKGVKSNGHT